MGARAQVYIKDEKVYLYTHWGAGELEKIVKTALAKRWRWNDPEYLARIIFCEMIKGCEDNETGFGIGTSKHSDIEKFVGIDCKGQKIEVRDVYKDTKIIYSFEDFIK